MATYYEDRTMKYLMVIALLLGSFALTQHVHAREAFEEPENCDDYWYEGERQNCRARERYLESQQSEITDVDPLTETAQGGDKDGEDGGGDFDGEKNRAAASTAAE